MMLKSTIKKYNSNNQLSERLDYDCPDGPYPNL